MELDWVERGILGFLISIALLLLYAATKLIIALVALIAIFGVLGFVGEKIIDHILNEEQ